MHVANIKDHKNRGKIAEGYDPGAHMNAICRCKVAATYGTCRYAMVGKMKLKSVVHASTPGGELIGFARNKHNFSSSRNESSNIASDTSKVKFYSINNSMLNVGASTAKHINEDDGMLAV